MIRRIKKVAILGSGIMGSRIACHFANIGIETILLDIIPFELNEAEKSKGLTIEDKVVRNRIVNDAFKATLKSKPASLYHKSFKDRITVGNFDDNLDLIKDADLILEAVIENLDIKKSLFEKVERHRKEGTIIASNTSGIPIHLMLDGRSEDFQQHFCGVHFFNPPRYLKLLEVIPTPKTKTEVVDFLMEYGDKNLGKRTVLCKDTPAFIANRVGIYAILKVVESMQKLGLNVDQIDKLTGPVIGRPKSATFRTSDVVGLDTLAKVANNLHAGLVNDEARDIFKLPDYIGKMLDNNMLGDKTKQGFYKKTKDENGKRKILTLDIQTFEYNDKQKVNFPTLGQTKPIENLKDRFPILLGGKDEAGEFYRDSFFGLFQYVTNRIPEIADELYKIDQAICAGFGWEMGPFETWDAVGLKKSINKMEEAGYTPNQWVYDMLDAGCESFYVVEDGNKKYYDVTSKSYKALPGGSSFIILDNIRKTNKVWGNAGATLFDIGDGVLNLEFHTKMNTLGGEVISAINKSISIAEENWKGLVIGNQAPNFSAGANLALLLMYAIEQEYDEINMMIAAFQKTMMRLRYSSIPTVAAPHGMALAGGCELTLHTDLIQAAAETYTGLVEVGVGLIPAGGGTKELTLRVSDRIEAGDVELNALQNSFMHIATGKVATSAYEAFDMRILTEKDRISINKDRQIADAKNAVLKMVENGYNQPKQRDDIKVQGRAGMALFTAGVMGMRRGNYISDHDVKIAEKISYVMNGGDLSQSTLVSEQYLLDLEREAFLSLTGERKTLERIQHMLKTGKPLRN